jgi:hypothetical protein
LGSQLALRHLGVAGHFDRGLPVRPFVRARGDPRQPSAQVNTWRPASPVQADTTDLANAAGVDPQDPFFVVSSEGTAMRVIAFGILALIVSLAAIHEPSSEPATMMAEQATTPRTDRAAGSRGGGEEAEDPRGLDDPFGRGRGVEEGAPHEDRCEQAVPARGGEAWRGRSHASLLRDRRRGQGDFEPALAQFRERHTQSGGPRPAPTPESSHRFSICRKILYQDLMRF